MQTVRRSRIWASALTTGDGERSTLTFILTMLSDGKRMRIVRCQTAWLSRWKWGYARALGAIAGVWVVTIRSTTSRDRLSVGMLHTRISKIARGPRRDC